MTGNSRRKGRFSAPFPKQSLVRREGRPRRIGDYHRAILAAHLYDLGFAARDISKNFGWTIDEDGRCRTALAWIGEGRRILDDDQVLLRDPAAVEASRTTSAVNEMWLPSIVQALNVTARMVALRLLHHATDTRRNIGKKRRIGRPANRQASTLRPLRLVLGEKRWMYECYGLPAKLALEALESREGIPAWQIVGRVLKIPDEELMDMGGVELKRAAMAILAHGFTLETGKQVSQPR